MAKDKKIAKKRTLLQKIVNVFLYSCIVLLVIFLIILGITQTSTFREYLKEKITIIANKELNGHLSIGKIDGTLFTSLVLRNTVVNMGNDTLLNAGVVEVKTSPLRLFFKTIYVRKLEISNAKIAFIKDKNGDLNIAKLFPQVPKDSTHNKFPFKIIAPDIKLTNINFLMQNYDQVNNRYDYDKLNFNDLRIKNLYLSLSASADIGENQYEIQVNNFSFIPNLKNFKLNNLTGVFYVDTNRVYINNLKISSDSTDIFLNAKVNKFNLFDSTAFSRIDAADLNVLLKASKFNFGNLALFVPAVNILNGTVSVSLEAFGTLKDLTYNRLEVEYLGTHLELKGKLRDILESDKMYITADFLNSRARESDADKLLPSIEIPVFEELGVVKFDTLRYSGNPLNFRTKASLRTIRGNADIDASIDLRKTDMQYDIALTTKNLDLSPITKISTSLNSKCLIKGSGTSPAKLNSTIIFTGNGSSFDGNKIDSLKINAEANNKNITNSLMLKSDSTAVNLSGSFNFADSSKPAYNLTGTVRNFNLAEFSRDTSMGSNINLTLNGNGDNFSLDKLNLYLILSLNNSSFHKIHIDSTRAIVDIRSNDNGERVINLISDLADITLIGNYSLNSSINMVSREASILSKAANDKINKVVNPDSILPTGQAGSAVRQSAVFQKKMIKKNKEIISIPSSMDMKYYVEFKNFDLLSLLFGSNQFSVDGEMSGEIKNNGNNFIISNNTNLNYIKYWGQGDIYFISNLNLELNVKNNIDSTLPPDIASDLKITSDRIFAGSDIYNLFLNLKLQNDSANIKVGGKFADNMAAMLSGDVNFSNKSILLRLDTLNFGYNKFSLINKGTVQLNYSKDKISIDNFDLTRGKGEIKINGLLSRNGSQDLKIEMININGKDFTENIFNISQDNSLEADIHFYGEITGNFSNPVDSVVFGVDNLKFKGKYFGSLSGRMNYSNRNLGVNISFADSTRSKSKPALLINGNIPIDLALTGSEDRMLPSKQIDLGITANEFDLNPLEDVLPEFKKLKGQLVADLKLSGTFEHPDPSGLISLNNAAFLFQPNNLEYSAGIKINIQNHIVNIDTLTVSNVRGTTGGGTMTGSGKVEFSNFSPASASVAVNGSLKVLSEDSKPVSPSVYGDLVILTDGNIEFSMNSQRSFVKVPVIVKLARLTFPLNQSGYQSSTNNFIYRNASDTTRVKNTEQDFETLIRLAKENKSKENTDQESAKSAFDYSLNIDVQNEAVLKFALSKELNQNLTAVLKGKIQYDNIGGKTFAQGELTLLEGSTLEYIKKFDAAGSIRFESELNNPYLNIVATYKNYYQPPEPDSKEEEVAVKIKLTGPFNDLSKNFINDQSNIQVYLGADNIDNDKPDETKDKNDAFWFILTDKFQSDLSQQQQEQAVSQSGANRSSGSLSSTATSTATSLAGSLIGGFLNQQFGDVVRGVELRNSGATTKFNVIGKVQNFTYTVGGSAEVFQDLSQANVKIEYPVFKNFVIRLERKEAITQESISNEMINELGLKYRFEF